MAKNIYFFIGTTAELLKLFPVIRELEQRKIKFKIITSGQTGVNFDEVSDWIRKVKPDIVLPGKANQSSVFLFFVWVLRTLISAPFLLLKEFKKIDRRNSCLVVHGDTVSSLIGVIIAKVFNLKVVHIESGLRSFNFLEPFPEEITRFIISMFADLHFCPNKWSLTNLRAVGGEKINTFQNTFIESYAMVSKKTASFKRSTVRRKRYFVFILHRQEHIIFQKEESRRLTEFVIDNAPANINCVFIKHATTLKFIRSLSRDFLKKNKNRLHFLPRLAYANFVHLLEEAEFLVTDGGGNQEEAYYMGLPCLILRNHSERIEGLGKNVVIGRGNKRIIKFFLQNYKSFRRERVGLRVRPSRIIVDYLLKN